MKGLSVEVRVGLLVIVALALLAGFVFVLGGVDLGEGYTLFVDFKNPGNVQAGAPVNVGSVRVGRVEDVEYRGGRLDPETGRRPLIRIRVRLDEKVRDTVHEDAIFYVTSTSLLGEQILAINPGDPERPVLPAGSIVEGVDPPRLDLAFALMYELLENISNFMRNNRDEIGEALSATGRLIQAMDGLMTENQGRIGRIIANVETASEQTNELLSNANGTLSGARTQRILANLDRTLAVIQRDIDPIMTDVRSATGKVDEVLDVMGPDERAQLRETLTNVTRLSEQANSALSDAQTIVAHVRQGRGTVGALLMDEEIYDDVQEMLRDLKHNPWKLFWRE